MISAIILTKNNQDTLRKTLESTKFLKEVILIDTGSDDNTLSIAKEYPHVKILTHDFIGFGPLRNFAAEAASSDWVLSLDSDEVISADLQKTMQSLTLNPDSVYSFPFDNYFDGKQIKWCGWYPDRHVRLYPRHQTQFSEDFLHEKVISKKLKEIRLIDPIEHYSYRSISDFLTKMQRYSNLFAKQYQGKKKASLGTAIFHGFFAFFKSYILQKGFLGGSQGFIISTYNGHTAYYKYLKLREVNKRACSSR